MSSSTKAKSSSTKVASLTTRTRFDNLFTKEHDAYLIRLKDAEIGTWDHIAEVFNERFPPANGQKARTKGGLQVRYSRNIQGNLNKNSDFYKEALAVLDDDSDDLGAPAASSSSTQPSSSKSSKSEATTKSAKSTAKSTATMLKQPPSKKPKLATKGKRTPAAATDTDLDEEPEDFEALDKALDKAIDDAEDNDFAPAEDAKQAKGKQPASKAARKSTRQAASKSKPGESKDGEWLANDASPDDAVPTKKSEANTAKDKRDKKTSPSSAGASAKSPAAGTAKRTVEGEAAEPVAMTKLPRKRDDTVMGQAKGTYWRDGEGPTVVDFNDLLPFSAWPSPLLVDPQNGELALPQITDFTLDIAPMSNPTTYLERMAAKPEGQKTNWRPITKEHLQAIIKRNDPDVPLMIRRPSEKHVFEYNPVTDNVKRRWRWPDDPKDYPSDPYYETYEFLPLGVTAADVPTPPQDIPIPANGKAAATTAGSATDANDTPTKNKGKGRVKGKVVQPAPSDASGSETATSTTPQTPKVSTIKRLPNGDWPAAPKLTANANFLEDMRLFGSPDAAKQYKNMAGNSKFKETEEASYEMGDSAVSGALDEDGEDTSDNGARRAKRVRRGTRMNQDEEDTFNAQATKLAAKGSKSVDAPLISSDDTLAGGDDDGDVQVNADDTEANE